jgi:outer membrane protein TolC
MSASNSNNALELAKAKEELARLKAEKLRLFPPNPHPLAQPDQFPKNATPEQIRQRNELVARIEELEKRVEALGG